MIACQGDELVIRMFVGADFCADYSFRMSRDEQSSIADRHLYLMPDILH